MIWGSSIVGYLATLANIAHSQQKMSEVLVDLFENSKSFASAKARIGYLEDLEVWDPSFSTRIKSAAKANSQIDGSWGVAERVTALVAKWTESGV